MHLLIKHAPPESTHAILCVDQRNADINEWPVELFVHQRRGKFDWGFFRTCRNCISQFNPDVIHVWLPPVISIPALVMAAIQGKPVVFSYRNLMRFRRALDVVEYCAALLCSTKVISNNLICQSSWAYRLLYHLKNGCTIPNGFDFSALGNQIGPSVKSGDLFRLIFVGRLVEQKNILYLIRALALLPRKYNWQLNVYGEGSQKSDAIKIASEHGIIQNIVFHGFEPDIFSKIAESDLLVIPSVSEGMPNVLIEALSIKIPVVASSIPAILDVVGDSESSILIDPSDPRNIADGIRMFMDNHGVYLKNAEKGFLVAKRYDARTMSIKYYDEYEKLNINHLLN
ncbi:glycosyltransferase involved in cell wall biosynthesis [Desulfomicrobium macestii]|uniref:Glycosyltransferase involved in cell wall biosynthesis n=1 Tax=Desulfomicrobium macestii TaxID=90731 RepID=A0ABR9H5G4_9BACT|nr:glycosyltransferase involved in cell wall biosynthesis [Desulfomicrobium macestii]